MCKEMPVIPVNRVVDLKRTVGKKWRAEEEERHKGLLTKNYKFYFGMRFFGSTSVFVATSGAGSGGLAAAWQFSPVLWSPASQNPHFRFLNSNLSDKNRAQRNRSKLPFLGWRSADFL
jgi:hypothetical protein